MYRGTTPKVIIELDVKVSDIEVAYLTFTQNNIVMFEKTLDDCHCADNVLTCVLTQDETLSLAAGVPLVIQARVKMKDGTATASGLQIIKVLDVFKDGVI